MNIYQSNEKNAIDVFTDGSKSKKGLEVPIVQIMRRRFALNVPISAIY